MQIKGKVTALPEIQTGETKSGNAWKKQTVVIETGGQYPKTVAVDFFNKEVSVKVGDVVTIEFEPQSREYNDRYYTNLGGWKIEQVTASKPEPEPGGDKPSDGLPW